MAAATRSDPEASGASPELHEAEPVQERADERLQDGHAHAEHGGDERAAALGLRVARRAG